MIDKRVRLALGPLDARLQRWLSVSALREAIALWAVCFGATLIAYQAWPPAAKVIATVGFLYLPLYACRARGEDWPEFGLSMRTLGSDVLTPYTGAPNFELRLPSRFTEWAIDDLFVVALPEEFFYRGYIQSRLRDAWPKGKMFFGARLGAAFWLTAVLFALGHLAIFQVWRLGVFFPALLFGWMRERSNSVVGPALFHAASNLLIKVLDASFFGRV